MRKELVRMENIIRTDHQYRILDNAWIHVFQGESVGLLGLNDAGKSVLMQILAGNMQKTSGRIYLNEKKIEFTSLQEAEDNGVFYIHNERAVIDGFSIMENLFVARHRRGGILIHKKSLEQKTQRILQLVGLDMKPTTRVTSLDSVQRIILQIAKAISHNSKLIIIDNILPLLSQPMIERLRQTLEHISFLGISYIFVDYRAYPLMQLCNRIFIIRKGRMAGSFEQNRYDEPTMTSIMVGHEVDRPKPGPARVVAEVGKPLFEAREIDSNPDIQNLSFSVRYGQTIGICTMSDLQKLLLQRLFFGIKQPDGGQFLLEGRAVEILSPQQAVTYGIGLVSHQDEVFNNLNFYDNVMITTQKQFSSLFGVIKDGYPHYVFNELYSQFVQQDFGVNRQSIGKEANKLLRKIITVMRYIALDSRLLIYCEPTREMDVVSTHQILKLIRSLVGGERSALIISSNISDLINTCDKVYFLHKGRITNSINVVDNISDIVDYYQYFCELR